MRKGIKICACMGALLFSLPVWGGCGEEKSSVQAISPKNGKIVLLANDEVANFASGYMIGKSDDYRDIQKGDHYFMEDLKIEWTATGEPVGYEVKLSRNADMSNAQIFNTDKAELTLPDLLVSTTYYWQVTADYGTKKDASKIFSFKTASTPRTIKIDGVSNTRDIGGYMTESGKRVRQGMAFRGAYLDEITPQGRTDAIGRYAIKTDLDLRKSNEGTSGQGSPLGEDILYYNYSCPYYLSKTGTGINNPDNHENLANAVRVFANESNYPVLFHCSVGRDRTGMISMLLLGLLGVGYEDICMDYELSFFSYRGCLDGATTKQMMDTFTSTYIYIAKYLDVKESFAVNCEAYLLDVGVTQAEIDEIRRIML
ncbi:MAG: tyrosine-protein phosphatase [Clostridia bacterium]|nr:tyrosine-protein phosphatase [Clostridia bacterium]